MFIYFSSIKLIVLLSLLVCCQFPAIAFENRHNLRELKNLTFTVENPGEVGLEIDARSPGSSWATSNAEGAALIVTLDDSDKQDILLFAGDEPFKYRIALGRLEKGKHNVVISLNPDRSAPNSTAAQILGLRPVFPDSDPLAPGEDGELAQKYSPVLFARANTIDRFSDIPLLMYYEIEHPKSNETLLTYTIIFTNEDGGTPSAALMARWGRGTDIEWVYRVRLNGSQLVEEAYQGVQHQTKNFRGERTMGMHPLLADASDNNNFSDTACSVMKFALRPIKADLSNASRETVMDAYPWTYKIMSQELFRERKISAPKKDQLALNLLNDPREYLYLEGASIQDGTSVAFEVHLNNSTEVLRSDLNDPRLRIDRSGYFRSAIPVPHGFNHQEISEVSLRCYATQKSLQNPIKNGSCRNATISRLMILDETYVPTLLKLSGPPPQNLSPDGLVLFHPIN